MYPQKSALSGMNYYGRLWRKIALGVQLLTNGSARLRHLTELLSKDMIRLTYDPGA